MSKQATTLEHAQDTHGAATSPGHVVDELIARGRELYTLPKVALDVLDLTDKPQTDALALKECIERDPALTARVLRVVNSALFGLSTQVTDLAHAVGLLGIKPLKLLVLGFSLPPALFEGLDESALELYWKTSLIRAAACREIARATKQVDGEEAFVAGLLEDLGVLLLIQQFRGAYTTFYLEAANRPGDLAQCERDQLGFDHRQVTGRLLQGWHFPDRLVQAIARPPAADIGEGLEPQAQTLARLLRLAEHLVELLSASGHYDVRALVREAEQQWSMSVDDVRALVDRLEGSVPPLAEIFAVPWNHDQYTQCLAAAHQAMANATETAPAIENSPREPETDTAYTQELREVVARWMAGETPPRAKPAGNLDARRAGTVSSSGAARNSQSFLDPALEHQLAQAALVARQCQRPLSLCLVGCADSTEFDLRLGLQHAAAVWQRSVELIGENLEPSMPARLVREGLIAAVCIGHERTELVSHARAFVSSIAQTIQQELGLCIPAPMSAGVAVIEIPPRNFEPAVLFEAAERCWNSAHASGGHTVKSIAL